MPFTQELSSLSFIMFSHAEVALTKQLLEVGKQYIFLNCEENQSENHSSTLPRV